MSKIDGFSGVFRCLYEKCIGKLKKRKIDPKSCNDSIYTHLNILLTAILQLFVYLFAPIAHHLKESDFQNFRLENGLRLWQGMWEFKAPGAPCFSAPVKPKARQLLSPTSPRGSLVFSTSKSYIFSNQPRLQQYKLIIFMHFRKTIRNHTAER